MDHMYPTLRVAPRAAAKIYDSPVRSARETDTGAPGRDELHRAQEQLGCISHLLNILGVFLLLREREEEVMI